MSPEILALTINILVLLFSVILHEVMHGWVALKFGDRTAQLAGRLTLNPIPHIDPIGTILMPAIFVVLPLLTGVQPGIFLAWAKPVPVNPFNFTDLRRGEFLVSIAGIGANIALALIGTLIYHISPVNSILKDVAQFTVGINLILAIFNLLPIPPLDGSKVLASQLGYAGAKFLDNLNQYGFLILIALLYTGIIGFVLRLILQPLSRLLGVPMF